MIENVVHVYRPISRKCVYLWSTCHKE